ncbi:hypothetical protein FBY13_114156 [Pantoea sp. SJZ147]|nr:hypothetical protein FBY13_114156 [Pantoea sp. SJZ147]
MVLAGKSPAKVKARAKGQVRVFEHNLKHRVKEYRAAGELVRVMDLSPADAQLALSNGIKVNANIYSYFNSSWYQFHCHQGNIYHGFSGGFVRDAATRQRASDEAAPQSQSLQLYLYGTYYKDLIYYAVSSRV